MENKIPVIYILSNGRSGSTLLDLLLGAHPNIWTIGEAQILPWELRENRRPCGCGVLICDCAFWRSVLPEVPLNVKNYSIEYFRAGHGRGKVLRWRHMLSLMRGRATRRWRPAAQQYGQVNADYFGAVLRAAEKHAGSPVRWLVDASKDPYRLLWLQSSGLFDLRVIHLTKDPRAFVHSMIKPYLSKAHARASRMTGRWLVENFIFSRLCLAGFLPSQIFSLRYEELANKPQDTLLAIAKWLGLEYPETLCEVFRQCENHGVSGNKARWESTGIRLDEGWKTMLPASYARVIWAVTWPIRCKYGYR